MKRIYFIKIVLLIIFFSNVSLASLSSHPSNFSEHILMGETKSVELHISNSISSPLNFTFSIPVNWIQVVPEEGVVDGNSTITVIITFNASNLTNGQYSTEIALNDPHHGAILIPVELNVGNVTGVKEDNNFPSEFRLMQNYPNPFNPSTNISFSLPKDQHVLLSVYNIQGIQVKSLLNDYLRLGSYNIKFDAMELASGIYFYRIQTEEFNKTNKMILNK